MSQFLHSVGEPAPALTSCSVGMLLQTQKRTERATIGPTSKGPAFRGVRACFLPGAHAVRRNLFLEMGGFDPRCTYRRAPQTGSRLSQQDHGNQRTRRCNPDCPGQYTIRDRETGRRYAKARLESSTYVMDKHSAAFDRDPALKADYRGVGGVAAAALGRRRTARSLLIRSALAAPTPVRIGRALAAWAPSALQPRNRRRF